MMRRFVAAAIQMNSTPQAADNLANAAKWIKAAAEEGASLIVLPELFACYGDLAQTVASAEPLAGPLVRRIREWAETEQVWLVAGSIAEQDTENARAYNTSLLIDPRGQIVAKYRKRHMFNIDLARQLNSCESDFFAPGNELTTARTERGVIGISICYDLRFPEQFRALSAAGAQILAVPAAFTKTTGRDHWEILVRTRALENQCYLIAANQVGQHSTAMSSFGQSCIIDPWGTVLAKLNNEDPGMALAEIDLDFLQDVRRQLPALEHRRDILSTRP
jgi:predicted amidohydrolase